MTCSRRTTTPSCSKTKTTDLGTTVGRHPKPATATPRVFAFCGTRGPTSRSGTDAHSEKVRALFAQSDLCDAQSFASRRRAACVFGGPRGMRATAVIAIECMPCACMANSTAPLQAASLLACVASHARGWREVQAGDALRSHDCRRARSPARRRADEKVCVGLLTVEKSMIRFRPADVSCRSE